MKQFAIWTNKTIYQKVAFISVIIFIIFFTYCLFISVIPLDIVVYKNNYQTILNPNKQVRPGGVAVVEIDRCKTLPFTAVKTETYLTDEVTWALNVPYEQYNVGCGKIILNVTIPKIIPAGETVNISRTLTYQISPFSTVRETWTSENFNIVP